ncbi:MAG: DNA polymerase [candidate division WOR-3 bacterium]
MKVLSLFDANSIAYRSFFVFKENPLFNSAGENTSAEFGFLNSILRVLKETKSNYIGICFDKGKSKREVHYKEYKIQRPKMPDELTLSLIRIKQLVSALNYKIFEVEGYEADDVIATLVFKLKDNFDRIYIISSDKDLLQLVGNNVFVYDTRSDILYTREKVIEKFSVEPKYIPDYLTLVGDAADNIEGVKGIGQKRAIELINTYGSLENIIENLDKLPISISIEIQKQKDEIIKRREELFKLKILDLEVNEEELKIREPNRKKLFEILRYLEFYKFMEDFSKPAQKLEILESDFEIKDFDIVEIYGNYIYKIKDGVIYKRLLKDEDLNKVFVVFDSKTMFKNGVKEIGFDLILADYLIDPDFASNKSNIEPIEYILLKYLGEKILTLDKEQIVAQKLRVVYLLKDDLENKMRELEMEKLLKEIEIPVSKVICNMEEKGIKVDIHYLRELSKEFEMNLKEIEKEIYELANVKFNINSPKQLSEVLFNKLKLKPIKKTKTGYSTDTETLIELSKIHPIAKKILEYRELFKLKTTYIDSIISLVNPATNRIYPKYNQRGTATGRISAYNPNIQTIPIKSELGKKIRKAFISDEGKIFIKADYSQIELRVLAHLSEDENLIYAYLNDFDVHTLTSRIIFSKDEINEDERRIGKTVNFAIIYGVSPYGLSKQLNIDQKLAEEFIRNYFEHYKGVKEWIEKTKLFAIEKGYVKTILNRRRIIPKLGINSPNKVIREAWERICINAPVQGSASDIMKIAMIKTLGFNPILQIHDELVFEVDEDLAKEHSKQIKEIMENVINLKVPLKVDIEISKTL